MGSSNADARSSRWIFDATRSLPGRTVRLLQDRRVQLLAILAVAAAIRYFRLENARASDEYNEVFEALRVASGRFNTERWIKKAFQNILAVEYGVWYLAGRCSGRFKDRWDFAGLIVQNMKPLLVIGRYTVATMGVMSVGLVYRLGSRLFEPATGLVAALLFCLIPVHVWCSHIVGTDVPLTFFFLISMIFVANILRGGGLRDYLLAGFFGGVAISTKMHGIGLLTSFVLVHAFRSLWDRTSARLRMLGRESLGGMAAIVVGLVLSNPSILIAPWNFLRSFVWYKGVYTNVYDEAPQASSFAALDYLRMLVFGQFGVPLALVVLAGMVWALRRRTTADWTLLGHSAVFFALLSGTRVLVQDRYLMTLFPLILILAARFLVEATGTVRNRRFGGAAAAGLFVVLLAKPVGDIGVFLATQVQPPTSEVAKEWIEHNIAAGSKILNDSGKTINTYGPMLAQSPEKVRQIRDVVAALPQGSTFDSPLVKIVDSYASIYFDLLLRNPPPITYDLTSTVLGREVETVDDYIKAGYQYFIISSDITWNLEREEWRARYPRSVAFYESLDRDTRLQVVRRFTPGTFQGGPAITVYRLPARPAS